jgi:hypothetical protein
VPTHPGAADIRAQVQKQPGGAPKTEFAHPHRVERADERCSHAQPERRAPLLVTRSLHPDCVASSPAVVSRIPLQIETSEFTKPTPADQVELLSEVHLRKTLGLSDGDLITSSVHDP